MRKMLRTLRWAVVPALLAMTALCAAGALAATYGTQVARSSSGPESQFAARFDHVRAPHWFVFVVTQPSSSKLEFTWSVRCFSGTGKASGGASGEAAVANGHWVKRIRANWIQHPSFCLGSIEGASGSSPVLARIFTN